jgi:enoyl-CoA hydratase/carnithine racemase
VNAVVPEADVLPTAIQFAKNIVQNSPDAVQSTKRGLTLAQQHNFEGTVLTHIWSPESTRMHKGENIKARSSITLKEINKIK